MRILCLKEYRVESILDRLDSILAVYVVSDGDGEATLVIVSLHVPVLSDSQATNDVVVEHEGILSITIVVFMLNDCMLTLCLVVNLGHDIVNEVSEIGVTSNNCFVAIDKYGSGDWFLYHVINLL
jgi:hypothetical protein